MCPNAACNGNGCQIMIMCALYIGVDFPSTNYKLVGTAELTRRAGQREACKEAVQELLYNAIESYNHGELVNQPLPPVVLTACVPLDDPYGVEDLCNLIICHQEEVYGHVAELQRAIVATIATMVTDVERMHANANAYDRPDPAARAPVNERLAEVVGTLCDRFNAEVTKEITDFLTSLQSRAEGQRHLLQSKVEDYLRSMAWQSMRAVLSKLGGPHDRSDGSASYNVNLEVLWALAGTFIEQRWQQIFDRITKAADDFEARTLPVLNEALLFALNHPYFSTLDQNGLTHLELLIDLREELPGNSLVFLDRFLPEEILRSRRGLSDRACRAVQEVAIASEIYSVPRGDGFARDAPPAVGRNFDSHKDIVCAIIASVW